MSWAAEAFKGIDLGDKRLNKRAVLLVEQLHAFGIDLSSGELSRLLTAGHEAFHAEADAVLRLAVSEWPDEGPAELHHRAVACLALPGRPHRCRGE